MNLRAMPAVVILVIAALLIGVGSASAETALERGTYLMRGIVACGNCHTTRDAAGKIEPRMELAGGTVFVAPVFRAVAPNITPDPETGIGRWTDDQIIDAIRDGKRPDGTIIGPPMPIDFYRGISDADVRALVAYLRAVPPVRHQVEKSVYKIPLPPSYGPPAASVPSTLPSDKIAYGHYLASNLGHCLECHTPRAADGQLVMDKLGAGGQEIEVPWTGAIVLTSNLTPANPAGMARWTDQQIKTAITKGERPDRPLAQLMAFDWYQNISDADLDALVAYLRTLKPAVP
ncbi:MAG TPA: c-type cytochrome [Stellaceae bacterium]|nr:c-type cytochrome [Stellaceae bacterium]